jgi:hypothetical protein
MEFLPFQVAVRSRRFQPQLPKQSNYLFSPSSSVRDFETWLSGIGKVRFWVVVVLDIILVLVDFDGSRLLYSTFFLAHLGGGASEG